MVDKFGTRFDMSIKITEMDRGYVCTFPNNSIFRLHLLITF